MKKLFALILCGLFLCIVPQVQAEKINEWVEIEEEFYNTCTGEKVLFSGETHTVGKIMETKNGKRLSFKSNENTNMVGIGMTSGDPYYFKIVENQFLHISGGGNNQQTIAAVSNARIVNLATGVVAIAKYVGHIITNANGEMTADIQWADFKCSEFDD